MFVQVGLLLANIRTFSTSLEQKRKTLLKIYAVFYSLDELEVKRALQGVEVYVFSFKIEIKILKIRISAMHWS